MVTCDYSVRSYVVRFFLHVETQFVAKITCTVSPNGMNLKEALPSMEPFLHSQYLKKVPGYRNSTMKKMATPITRIRAAITMHNTGKQKQENECKTQYENINSPNWSPYVFLQYWLREFVKRSKQFLFGDPLSILIRALIG